MSKWLVAGQWRKTVYKEQMRERRILDNFPQCHHFLLKLDQCMPWLWFINLNLVHHCHHCVQHHQLLACNPRWSWSGKLMSWKYTVWRTWFIISMPWIRLRDFLSNCLKIFISESICFTKSWNSLVSLPCCTLWKQQICVIGKVCGGLDRQTHLAPSLTEEAVASADGRIAAAVAANRVRSLRKNTAPANSSNNTVLTARQWNVICGIGKCFIQQANAKQERNPIEIIMKLAQGDDYGGTCNCGQRSWEEKNVSENWAAALASLLVLLKGVFGQDEIVDEVLILRHKQLWLHNLLRQLHLQTTKYFTLPCVGLLQFAYNSTSSSSLWSNQPSQNSFTTLREAPILKQNKLWHW